MVRSRAMAILHVSFHVFGEYLRDITPKGSPVLEKYLRDVIGRPLSRCTWVGSQRMRLFYMFVVFVPTAYRRDISCWNISFFLPLLPYTKPRPRSFKPIQNLDLFQAVIYDSRGVFGGENIY